MPRHNARTSAAARTQAAQPDGAAAQQAPQATIPGGAAGLPQIDGPPRFSPQLVDGPGRYATARKYMVVDGPRDASSGKIRYNDPVCGLVNLSPGKEVTENTHNLDHMRRQGIRLEVIPDEVVEEPEMPIEPEPEIASTPASEEDEGEGDPS